jgi:MFS family permease
MSCYYAILTNLSTTFYTLYGLSNTQISLVTFSVGCGGGLSTLTLGGLLDWNYRRHAKRLDFPLLKNHQIDLAEFPIELARLQISLPLILLGALAVIGYGWSLGNKTSVAAPIVFLVIVGYGVTAASQVISVLMSDI